MKVIQCDNEGCSNTSEYSELGWHSGSGRNWITAQRGAGVGNQRVTGPWHLCSFRCAKEKFTRLEGLPG